MKVTGIIMECNPFHEGHAFILREARRITQADYIIAAMSGDFVQRGEPAVFDKYIRAEQILQAGADLVLEIPLYAACGSAEYFARGGINLLEKLGVVTDLCFGSESGDFDNLMRCAQTIAAAERKGSPESTAVYREKLQAGLKGGMPFPAARAAALEHFFREEPGKNKEGLVLRYPSAPNDILGVEYCRALIHSGSSIQPHAISRIDVPTATQYRQDILADRSIPIADAKIIPRTSVTQVPLFPVHPDDFSDQLMYALLMQEEELDSFVDVTPELAIRIRKLLGSYSGFTAFCDLINTRSLARTRVSRCLLHILLQIRQYRLETQLSAGMALYARPLAINRAAAPLLSMISQNSYIPFLSKMSDARSHLSEKAYSFLEEEIRAEDLYCMTLNRIARDSMPGEKLPISVPGALQRKIPVKES